MNSDNYIEEYKQFQKYLRTGSVSFKFVLKVIGQFPSELLVSFFRNLSGPIGMRLRFYIYKLKLGGLGDGSLFDIGVNLVGVKNLYVGKKSWIDSYVCISAYLGTIQIGDNCHVGSHVVMGSREPIIIGNRVGIGAGAKIYSNTEKIQNDKFLAGPMIPEDLKGFFSRKVVIEDDVLIGANAVILPGFFIGRGAVIGANAIITESVEPWSVVIDRGKKIYHRPPLSDNTIRNFDDND